MTETGAGDDGGSDRDDDNGNKTITRHWQWRH